MMNMLIMFLYVSFLTEPEYKPQSIKYLPTKFATTSNIAIFIIDTLTFPCVFLLCYGVVHKLPCNEHDMGK